MATKKKQKGKESREPARQQVSFSVEPGTKVQITLDVGEKDLTGKIPVTVHVEQVGKEQPPAVDAPQPEHMLVSTPVLAAGSRWRGFDELISRLKTYDLAMWLFILAVAVYLVTRLIGLSQFPMYFFTDEAIQSQSIVDLVKNGYKDSAGVWFPTYFRNGEYYNISLSVYLQWLPYILFGKSAIVTRATSIFVTLI